MKIPGLLVRNSVQQETSHVGNCLCVVPHYTLVEVRAYVCVCGDVYMCIMYVCLMCMCMMVYMCVYMSTCMCMIHVCGGGVQRTTLWCSSSPSTFVCVLGVELRSLCVHDKCWTHRVTFAALASFYNKCLSSRNVFHPPLESSSLR